MENEDYTKVRIDDSFGMNVFNNKSRIEIFYKDTAGWVPVMIIEHAEFNPNCFIVSFPGSTGPDPYPIMNKRFFQMIVNNCFRARFNIDWRLPAAVTDILDSWIIMGSMTHGIYN